MRYYAKSCEISRYYAKSCEMMRHFAILCDIMRYFAKSCEIMRYFAILCDVMQTHPKLLELHHEKNVEKSPRLPPPNSFPKVDSIVCLREKTEHVYISAPRGANPNPNRSP